MRALFVRSVQVVKSLYALLGDLASMQGEEYDTPEKYVEKIFQEMDRDADGFLSFEEVGPPFSLLPLFHVCLSCSVLCPFFACVFTQLGLLMPQLQYKNGALEDPSIVKALGLF